MKKRILVVYATAGIGHKKAAIAVKKALDETAPKDIEVTLIDALDYTNAFFKWSYLKAYLLMVNKLPTFWGLSYYITDNFFVNLVVSKIRNISNRMNSKKFAAYLFETNPNVIISTHFFASEVISEIKKSGSLSSRLITVVTDYRLHAWWIVPRTDTYVVAGKEAKDDLVKWGIEADRVKVMGIPVEPVFSRKLDRQAMITKLHLKSGFFTVLVIGGGFGVGPIEDIIKEADKIREPIQVIAVCGHNEELAAKLNTAKPGLKTHLEVLGFIDNVYEYMEVSDILISKSGGITVSESLAKEIPMIIIAPILGQETRNAEFLLNNGAAFKINKTEELRPLLEEMISDRGILERMRKAISAVKKPSACYDVAKMAVDICEEKK
jgi:processive 1,2-diacylglycerol beta-glucosyltransferase